MISLRSAFTLAALIRTLGATPGPNPNQENVLNDVGIWTRMLDVSCLAESTCASELVPLKECVSTYYTKLNSGSVVPADLFEAEKCICSTPAPTCIACATAVHAANPSANQHNYTLFSEAYNDQAKLCAADGYGEASISVRNIL